MALGAQGTPLSPGVRQEFMMAEPSSSPPVSTFIVRFWREWSSTGPRWRGHIEHIQSGEAAPILDPHGILDFLQRYGIMADHSNEYRMGAQDERAGSNI